MKSLSIVMFAALALSSALSSVSNAAPVICGNASRAEALKTASDAYLTQQDSDEEQPQKTVTLAMEKQWTGRQGIFTDHYVMREYTAGVMTGETRFNVSGQLLDHCQIDKIPARN